MNARPRGDGLAAAGLVAAALLLLPTAAAAGVADVVEPCEGAGAADLMSYCCKSERSVPLLLLPDPAATGYVSRFHDTARSVLGEHGIDVGAVYGGDGAMGEQAYVENMPELCEEIVYALAGSIDKLKHRLPVVFVTYGAGASQGPDSRGQYIEDLHATCEEPIKEWFDDDEHREWLLNNLGNYEVVVINSYQLDQPGCWETIAHEVGHSAGLGHDGDKSNIMYGCEPGQTRSGLSHLQVAKICERGSYNVLPELP